MNSKAMMFGVILAVVLSAFVVVADAQETDAAVGCDISYIGDSESAVAVVELDSFQHIGNGGLFLVLTGADSVQMSQGAFTPPMTFTFERSPDLVTMPGHYTAKLVLNDRGVEQTIATGTMDVVEVTFTDGSSEVPMFIGGTVDVPNAEDLGLTGQGDFLGWATSEDGDVRFAEGGTMSVDDLEDETTLYAVYGTGPVVDEVKVTFDPNGGEGAMSEQNIAINTPTALTENTFTRDGHTFTGWNTAADGSGTTYSDGAEVTLTENLTLYAQWTPNTVTEYTVYIDSVEHVTITVKVGDRTITNGDKVADGTVLTVTYKVEEGYELVSSSGPQVKVYGDNVTITATVKYVGPVQPVLESITVSGPDAMEVGEALDYGDIVVQAIYDRGEPVTLQPGSDGYSIQIPAGAPDIGQPYTESGKYTYTVSYEGKTATFTVEVSDIVWDITYSKAQNGSVSGDSRVVDGGDADYTVRADYGYVIGTITVGGHTIDIESGLVSYNGIIEGVSSDVQVTVTFEEDTASQTVTVNVSGDGGRVTPSGTVPVYDHWGAIIYVETDTGYDVIVSGGALYDEIDSTITIPAGSDITTISVEFVFTGSTGEDDVPPRPPVNIPEEDDSTTYIVAIAAAAIVAILAALILMQTRKS